MGDVDGALGERFAVERVLGRGAFGTVYAAWDRAVDERVAVKRLDRLDPASRVRFKRELRALSRVRHEGLVALYELHPMGSTYGFSMELVEGCPFVDALRGATDRGALVGRLAEALIALHAEGWLHNDLKPQNALVTDDGRVVLLDFGLLGRAGADAGRTGTLAYMAPEDTATPARDWYAVGTMVFEALAGRLPHEGRGRHLLMRKRQQDAPPLAAVADVDDPWASLTDALLSRDPEARLEGLHDRLEAVVGARLEPTRVTPRFVGREAELAAIAEALDRDPGRSIVIDVRGPSGIGKSALLARAVRARPSAAALVARCNPQETLTAAGLDALVDALVELLDAPVAELLETDPEAWRALAAMFPQVGEAPPRPPVDPSAARPAAARGLARLLGALAPRPVLVIDDAQWLDDDSLDLLGALLDRTPLAVLLSTRTDLEPAAPPLAPDARVELSPLGDAQIEELIGARTYARLDPAAWRSAQGRPYLLLELARMARDGVLPGSTEAAVGRRLDDLSEDDRALLDALALAERPIERRLAARALGAQREGASFLDALSTLRARRLIEVHGARPRHSVQLQHDLVRRAVRDRLDDARAERVHAALDDSYEALGSPDPEAQGHHALGAGRLARGRDLLERAGAEAEARFAFARAARLYARARTADPGPAPRERALYEKEGEAWGKAGRGVAAARALDGAIARLRDARDTDAALRLECRRAVLLMRGGATDRAVRGQRAVLDALGLRWWRSPNAALGSVLAHRAAERVLARLPRPIAPGLDPLATDVCFETGLALTNVDPARGTEFVVRALARARAAGDRRRTARAAAFVACYAQNAGRRAHARAGQMIEEAEALAAEVDDPYASATVVAARCLRAFHGGRYVEAAERAQDTARAYATVPGAVRERATAELYEVIVRGLTGDYEIARDLTEQRVREAVERSDRFAETSLRTSLPNLVWLVADDPTRARAECDEAMRGWAPDDYHLQHLFDAIARARIALYEDRPGEAVALLETVWERGRRALHLRSPFIEVTLRDLRGRALARTVQRGERDRGALKQAREDAARIVAEGSDWSRGYARAVEAAIARAEGRDPSPALREARERFFEASLRGHAAAASFARTGDGSALRSLGVVAPARFARVLS